jgi:hypothetical protein
MEFGLVNGFTEYLQLITTSNNNSSWVYRVYRSLQHALSLLSLQCLHQSSPTTSLASVLPFFLAEAVPQLYNSTMKLILQTQL